MVYLTVAHVVCSANFYICMSVKFTLSNSCVPTHGGNQPSYRAESADPVRADAYEYVILTSITFAVLRTLFGISSLNASASNRFVGPETLIAPSG